MTEDKLKQAQKDGRVEEAPVLGGLDNKPVGVRNEPMQPTVPFDIGDYGVLLEAMRAPRRHLTAAPTSVPRNFAEQIQLYDDGVNRRLYLYVNGTWRYVALT